MEATVKLVAVAVAVAALVVWPVSSLEASSEENPTDKRRTTDLVDFRLPHLGNTTRVDYLGRQHLFLEVATAHLYEHNVRCWPLQAVTDEI